MYHIPLLDNILKKSCVEAPYYLYTTKQVEEIYKSILLFNMRFYSVSEFKKSLAFMPKKDIQNLNLNVRLDPILLLNFRGFLFYLIKNNICNKNEVIKSLDKFELNKQPKEQILRNLDIIPFIRETGVLTNYFKEIFEFPKVLDPKEVKDLCIKNIKVLKPSLKNYAYKKLRFIATSNNCTLDDLVSDLVYQACCSCYDLQSKLRSNHLLNSIRQSVTNYGTNLIYFYTAQSRQRIVEEENGFSSKLFSFNIGNAEGEEEDLLNIIPADDSSKDEIERKLSLYFEQKRAIETKGKESAQARLLAILSNDCQDFVDWYNKTVNNKKEVTQVIDIQELEKSKFLETVQKFLKLEKDKKTWNNMIEQLRPRLIDLL